MSESSGSSGLKFGPAGVLAAVFITLKLVDKIDWSWWWVLSPLWINFCVVMAFMAVVLVVAAVQK